MNKILRSNKGISLIELILTLALIVIILAIIYNIFFTGNKIFNISEAQTYIQSDTRVVADFITKELRNATVIGNKEQVKSNGNLYYALMLENNGDGDLNSLLRQTFTNEDESTSINEIKMGETFSNLKFSCTEDSEMLKIAIISNKKNQEYTLEFELLLNNINNVDIEGEVSEIYYIKAGDI